MAFNSFLRTLARGSRTSRGIFHNRLFSSGGQRGQNVSSGVDRINSRVPRFLQRYTVPLKNAPVAHITAFILLHEITAVVPLFGLAATFHYAQWLPPYISEGKYISDYVEKFGRYFRRKGWLGEEGAGRYKWWGRGEGGVRIVVELATAWAITKALLPLRLILSVWGTPWFARVAITPFTSRISRFFRSKKNAAPSSGAAGTGAVGAGVISKSTKTSPTAAEQPSK